MRQPAKGHSKFGDQLQNMHINQVCSDIDHLAAGPEKQNTLKKRKKKENKFAICEATTWCERSVVCGVLWCGVGHSTRRRVSSISETCIRLGLFRALGQAKYQLGSYQSALLLVACRSINIPLPLPLSLSLPLLPSLSVLSVCK